MTKANDKYSDMTRYRYLMRVKAVQDRVREVHLEGQPMSYVYRTYIENEFHIAEKTFRAYLGVSVNVELSKIKIKQ
jgi:hypothetical protein